MLHKLHRSGKSVIVCEECLYHCVLCVYKALPFLRPPLAPLFPPLFLLLLLKLMTWLLISAVWGPSTHSNGIIQAPFIAIFNNS